MIYPFDLTAELTSEESEEVDQAVEHWIWRGAGQWSEWCYPWAMILQSRWGMREAPSVLLEVWKRLFLNEEPGDGLSAEVSRNLLAPPGGRPQAEGDQRGDAAGRHDGGCDRAAGADHPRTRRRDRTLSGNSGDLAGTSNSSVCTCPADWWRAGCAGTAVCAVSGCNRLRSDVSASRFRPDGEVEEFLLSPENPLTMEFRD